MRVLIVVASQTGRTARMAEAAADGVREAGVEVEAALYFASTLSRPSRSSV